MGAVGYLFALVGALLIRQVVVGRAHETPEDIRDLFVGVITADMGQVNEVLTRRGENTGSEFVTTADMVATDADKLATGPVSGIGAKAIAWGMARANAATPGYHGRCLAFVQDCFSQGAHVSQESRGTAANAYALARYKHPKAPFDSIPAGVPVSWGGGAGHVVLSTGGGGCLGSDYPRDDVPNLSTLQAVDSWLGSSHTYLGWSNDSCGTLVRPLDKKGQ
jgi:hypothetical protein